MSLRSPFCRGLVTAKVSDTYTYPPFFSATVRAAAKRLRIAIQGNMPLARACAPARESDNQELVGVRIVNGSHERVRVCTSEHDRSATQRTSGATSILEPLVPYSCTFYSLSHKIRLTL